MTFAREGMRPHQVNFILLRSVEPSKWSRLGTNAWRAVRFLFFLTVSIYIWLEKGGGGTKKGQQGARTAVGQRATSQSAAVCVICRLSVGLFMEHLATLHRGIWWLPWAYTDTHTTICPHCHSNELGQHSLSPPFSEHHQCKPHVEGPGSRRWLTTKWPLTHTHTHIVCRLPLHPLSWAPVGWTEEMWISVINAEVNIAQRRCWPLVVFLVWCLS